MKFATMRTRLLLALSASIAVGMMASANAADDAAPAAGATAEEAAPAPAKPALNARKLFATNCSWCHQDYGMKAADGPKLAGTSLTEAEVIDRITRGKTPMPGFRKIMTADQIEALAKYIKGLKDPGN